MNYEEFKDYQPIQDENTLANAYQDSEGNIFYVEPGFYYGLMGFKEKRLEDFPKIMKAIDETIKKHHHVIFTADFEAPFYEREGYIYKEINDITDPLLIFVEDKSRGSDYGD